MPDAEHCLALADEAERLAAIVSYARDKTRLKQQAESWREKAKVMEAERAVARADPDVSKVKARRGLAGWMRRRSA